MTQQCEALHLATPVLRDEELGPEAAVQRVPYRLRKRLHRALIDAGEHGPENLLRLFDRAGVALQDAVIDPADSEHRSGDPTTHVAGGTARSDHQARLPG